MKKIVITSLAAVFMMSMVSCKSINVKREACDKGCETAKKECIDKAKDKKGNVNQVKKAACEATAQKCINECAKKYGAK